MFFLLVSYQSPPPEIGYYHIIILFRIFHLFSFSRNRICSSLHRFAKLLKLGSFYRKFGQMTKPGKVRQILAVGSSQNVVFIGPKTTRAPARKRGGAFLPGALQWWGICTPLGRLTCELSFFYSESHSTKNQQAKTVAHRCHIPHILVYAKCPCKPDKTKNSINQRNDLHALSFFSI